ncbi:MAG: putative TrmH family tRNA/rRNA methyltransferase YacO [Candidatus Kapaibacterium sp.]|nr:MAG: putative TrmH family tRNA/rRNA methyltransferase YacO [Candidatus Kapabacteria bacterium]
MQNSSHQLYFAGVNPTLEALSASEHAVEKIFIRHGASIPPMIAALARQQMVPVATLSREKFDRLARQIGATKHHQNIIALRRAYQMLRWDDVLALSNRTPPPIVVACDQITDPHNFGAIIRSAAAAGADAVVAPIHNSAPMTAATLSAASGAIEHIPLVRVRSLVTALADARERGFAIIGTAADGEQLYTAPIYDCPLIVVIGSEGSGIRRSIRRLCDRLVRIPLARPIESLNASVAAAVVLFEIRRQRTMG